MKVIKVSVDTDYHTLAAVTDLSPPGPSFRPESAPHNLKKKFNSVTKVIQVSVDTDYHTALTDLSPGLPSSSPSSQWMFTSNDREQEQPVTPKAGLTPRTSFSNLIFNDYATDVTPSPSPGLGSDAFSDDFMPVPCGGQPVEWTPGSVWDSYAYQMHDDDSLPWNLIGFQEGNFIIIQSKDDCTGSLFSDKERVRGSCNACFTLINSDDFRRFLSRAHQSEAKSHTPWKYLNRKQLAHLLVKSRKKVQDLHLKVCPISLTGFSQSSK